MAEEKQGSALAKGAQAAQMVRGAVKVGKIAAGAAKGAAAGPYGAAAGLLWESRHGIAKAAVIAVALLLLPVMFLLTLPPLVLGGFEEAYSPADPDNPLLNSSTAIVKNLSDISASINGVLSEALEDTLKQIDADFQASGADKKEIVNPYGSTPAYNANAFVAQYCAAQSGDYQSISLSGLEKLLRGAKGQLYTYTKEEKSSATESTNTTVNTETGEETSAVVTETTTTIIYTVVYQGETYFADHLFRLTPEQKTLADNYAQNLSLFLGDSMFQGLPAGYETMAPLGDIRFMDGQTPVVYYNQLDEQYAGKPYGTDNVGGYGCGPAAMAIVVSSLTSDMVDPAEMAQWSYEHGHWAPGNGSYRTLISGAAKAWGLPAESCAASDGQKIADALSRGKLVVAIMGKGHFTRTGHFIVLRGVKDGKILVADPASYSRSEQEWELSLILNEASKYQYSEGPFWIIG